MINANNIKIPKHFTLKKKGETTEIANCVAYSVINAKTKFEIAGYQGVYYIVDESNNTTTRVVLAGKK